MNRREFLKKTLKTAVVVTTAAAVPASCITEAMPALSVTPAAPVREDWAIPSKATLFWRPVSHDGTLGEPVTLGTLESVEFAEPRPEPELYVFKDVKESFPAKVSFDKDFLDTFFGSQA